MIINNSIIIDNPHISQVYQPFSSHNFPISAFFAGKQQDFIITIVLTTLSDYFIILTAYTLPVVQ
jgi:hypothetical protein